MSIFSKLFKKDSDNGKDGAENVKALDAQGKVAAISTINSHMKELADNKVTPKKSEDELLTIFANYFTPNVNFYSKQGSEEYQAYFGAINSAKVEMLNNPSLYMEATKRSQAELLDMLNNPKPMFTNMIICALIFSVGEFAVIKDMLYCVDFSEDIPNCVALYLLLIAQKKPEDKRTQIIDAGDGTNIKPLQKAVEALAVCDKNWHCKIL